VTAKERALKHISLELPASLTTKLEMQARKDGSSVENLIVKAVAQFLETPLHTFFQVSTSRSLVAGQYTGAITCAKLLEHGDFGLGTFAGLAGEMVIVDGRAYRVEGSGRISQAEPSDEAPFATVTRLDPNLNETLEASDSFDNLKAQLDRFRRTDNLFYAIRIDGTFSFVKTRAVSAPKPGATLLEAAKEQHEFEFRDSEGTLVGIYSPAFSSAISVPGYHIHYLSRDRTQGGHLLEIRVKSARVQVQELEEFHLALPENEGFLKADLSRDTSSDLSQAESSH
jgi:acetolactate decarboxylase